MIWTRETFGGVLLNDIAVSTNAALIIVFAAMTLRHAMARRIDAHHRWALRTFIAMSGVWFLRVIYAFLDAVPGETPGVADDMTGPTNIALNFASYLLPLLILELYLLARRSRSAPAGFAAAGLMLAASGATAIGVYGTAVRWLG